MHLPCHGSVKESGGRSPRPAGSGRMAGAAVSEPVAPRIRFLLERGRGIDYNHYWDESTETFYMLYAYRKSEQEDTSAAQLRPLSRLVRDEFR